MKEKQVCPRVVQVGWGENVPQSEHNTCQGPVTEVSPTQPRNKVGMAAAGTAEGPWGNFLVASQGGLGTYQEGLEELGQEPGLISESNGDPLTGFCRKAVRSDNLPF